MNLRAGKGSRKIVPEEKCPPNTKTNPKPNPNPNRGDHFFRDQLSGCPPVLKLARTLAQTPTLTGGGGDFFGGEIVRIPIFLYFHSFINLANETIVCI